MTVHHSCTCLPCCNARTVPRSEAVPRGEGDRMANVRLGPADPQATSPIIQKGLTEVKVTEAAAQMAVRLARFEALTEAVEIARSFVTPLDDGGGYPSHETAAETAEALAVRLEELRSAAKPRTPPPAPVAHRETVNQFGEHSRTDERLRMLSHRVMALEERVECHVTDADMHTPGTFEHVPRRESPQAAVPLTPQSADLHCRNGEDLCLVLANGSCACRCSQCSRAADKAGPAPHIDFGATRSTTEGSHHPVSTSVVDQIRADQRSAGGPLVVMRSAGYNEPDDRGAEDLPPVKVWGCVHGYTMPHADTLCPHCCPLAWRSGTTYSRDEHVAALEALEDSAMSCAAHLIARWLRRYADEHSGSHPANAGHIACNAAATELETGRAKWRK